MPVCCSGVTRVGITLLLDTIIDLMPSPAGDVLTGVIASLLAQGVAPVRAAGAGVWLHGRAGDLAAKRLTAYGMTPADVTLALPEAFLELEVGG